MIVVADAGPIIYLSAVGRLDLLPALYGRVIVPRLVFNEVVIAGDQLPGSAELAGASWVDVVEPDPADAVFLALREELDPGESAALSHAVRRGADLVLVDDRKARIAAKRLGVTSRSTLGILIEAKRKAVLDRIAPVLDELVKAGIWLSPSLIRVALEQAGEAAPATGG